MSYLTTRFFKKNKHYIAVFLPLFLVGCTTAIIDQPYHAFKCTSEICSNEELDAKIKLNEDIWIENGWSAVRSNEKRQGKTYVKAPFYSLYLEYKENGEKFEGTRQLDVIKRAIETSDKPVYLVVFVHGWHNNASIDLNRPSLDTTGFPYLLARRSFEKPDMNVIGVYVGWRGEEYKGGLASVFSLKSRANVADAIGNKRVVRDDIVSLVNNVQNNNSSGYSLIMGHSFGGRLLSRAFMKDLAETRAVKDWPLGSNSLLVTLNSAIGADAFDELYKDMPGTATDPKTGFQLQPQVQRPVWINLTSKDDDATSKYLPKARLLGLNITDNPSSGNFKTIGHDMKYLSYELTVNNGNTLYDKTVCNFINGQPISKEYRESKKNKHEYWFEIPTRNANHDNKNLAEKFKDTCDQTRYLYKNEKYNRYHTIVLQPLYENNYKPLGFMWNFRIDKSVMEHSDKEKENNKSLGVHNAFVQTTLGRMLDDMLFTTPEK